MKHPTPHRDAADRPTASHRPDLAAELDTMEDRLRELVDADPELEELVARQISELGVEADESSMRVAVAIAAGVLRKADDAGEIREIFGMAAPVQQDLSAFAAKLMKLIDGDGNPRLQAMCADFVLGSGLSGHKNQTAIGAAMGVTKATVSKRCRNLVRRLGRAPARGMKSEEAVAAYSERQMGKRQKPEREEWSFRGFLSTVFSKPQTEAICAGA